MTIVRRSLSCMMIVTASAAIAYDSASAQERALAKAEVSKLYAGKSWIWGDGVGYFAHKGRFRAITGVGKSRATMDGNWAANDSGRLCFAGVWKLKSGQRFNRDCFLHKISENNVYQKRLPTGTWYVFRHDPEKENDQKLVQGDQTKKGAIK